MKLDYLFFGAHPDDVELSCSGTILEARSRQKTVGIIDLTRGELGTRGNANIRSQEAAKAAELLDIQVRVNVELKDGFFETNETSLLKIIMLIRTYQPEIVFANALDDRHPDHKRGADLVATACFLSGLLKTETNQLPVWKPKNVFFYIQDKQLEPNFIIDISTFFERKKEIIRAYESQFFMPQSQYQNEASTYISSALFWDNLEAKARNMGQKIGVLFGEGFISKNAIGVKNVEQLLSSFF